MSAASAPDGRRRALALAITGAAVFMVTLDNLVVTNALPSIRADLGASISQLGWFVNAYTLTFAALLLTGASLGDRFGRRRVFAIGLADLHGRLAVGRARDLERHADRRARRRRAWAPRS